MSILPFTKQTLFLTLKKVKEKATLYHHLFEQKSEGQAIDFYDFTKSHLESLEEDTHYTLEQLILPLDTEGKHWYTWYRKTWIMIFLAQFFYPFSMPMYEFAIVSIFISNDYTQTKWEIQKP